MVLKTWPGRQKRSLITVLALAVCCATMLPAKADHAAGHAEGLAGSVAQLQSQSNEVFQTPVFQSPLILPTDTAGWGGDLGRTKGLRQVEGPPDLSSWLFHGQAPRTERDPRYSFTGVWSYFGEVDRFVATIQDKMPALAKVTGELKTPCGTVPQSMPPVPELPAPEKLGKPPQEDAAIPEVANLWHAATAKPDPATQAAARRGKLMFSRNCQGFDSGNAESGRRLIVGTPGTTVLAKAPNVLVVKVGRVYVHNGSTSADLEVESGRMSVIMPPGAAGIVDTASNGLTQYVSLMDSPRRQTRVVDLCNPSYELAKVDAGRFVTVAPEDSVVEDLVSLHGISETPDNVYRREGYVLVIGRFSMADAVSKESTLQSALFQSDPLLRQDKEQLIAASKAPAAPAKPLVAGVTATEVAEVSKEERRGAAFMPTRGARYGTLAANELMIADGAVLVRGADDPVIISAEVNRQKVMTTVKSGAVVMVSALDGRLTVLNLTETSPGSCTVYMPGPNGTRYNTLTVAVGQVAELYIDDGMEPPSTVLAYKIIDQKKFPGGVGVLIAKYDYLAAMKRFNLSFALPSQDLNKVLKTMAATAFIKYGETSR